MRMTEQQIREHARKTGVSCALDDRQPASLPKVEAQHPDDIEPADAFTGAEKLLHRDFAADMQRRGAWFVSCRTDERATIPSGYPDFHILYTSPQDGICRACAVEFKKAAGQLSKKQLDCLAEMRRRHIPVRVSWTLKDAIDFAKAALQLNPENQ